MGVPTQTQIHNMTDLQTAELEAYVAAYQSVCSGKSNSTLADYLLAGGDADLIALLLTKARACDLAGMPESMETLLAHVLGRSDLAAWGTGLRDAVVDEGGYASFDAYLTAKSAVVQALWAELYRRHAGGEASLSAANVIAPLYRVRTADRVYTGADGALVDDTTDAGSVAAADVALFAADDHCLYVGSRWKFNWLMAGLSTLASTDIEATHQYWNGTAWATLSVTDHGTGFTLNQPITWTIPTDWERGKEDGGGNAFADKGRLYWVRIQRTANVLVTPPVGSLITIAQQALTNSDGAHLGVPQGPLGLVRITNDDTITAHALNTVQYSRWAAPGLRLRALNAIGANATITVSYTDQNGAEKTAVQAPWATPAAGDTVNVTLDGADTGARAIRATGWAVTSTGRGVIAVESVLPRTPAV